MYCNNSGGACFFFDIDVKGGESVVMVRMLQWYGWMSRKSSAVLQVLQGFHQCQRGRLLAYLQTEGRVCLFVIDGKINTMRVYLFSNDSKINNAVIMAWKEQSVSSGGGATVIIGSPIQIPDGHQI
jgi:hypothetical protein